MLSRATRAQWATLLEARSLTANDDLPALIYLATEQPPITITRAQFRAQVLAYAAGLQHIGIVPRDLVIIAHTQNLESVYLFWAALVIGAVPSMFPTLTEKLDPTIYMHNLAELVRFSDVRAILTTDAFAPTLSAHVSCAVIGTSALDTTASPGQAFPQETLESVPQAQQVAFLQHSSGTTGLQKGVALSHAAVLNQLASYSDALALNTDDVVVSWLPLYHDMGLIAGFVLPIVQGIPLVLMSPFDWVRHPALLLRAIHEYHGTLCWLPNFAYNHLARRVRQSDSAGLSLASMRAFINCSEPVRADSHTLFAERFATNGVSVAMLQVSYAMAENTFAVTQTTLDVPVRIDTVATASLIEQLHAIPALSDEHATAIVSCGAPLTDTSVKVTDDLGNLLANRQVGNLFVRSNAMLTGYHQRADLHPFDADGWYDTGDRGYLADGEVYVIGRTKDLIINAGKNVYPQDLEAVVNGVAGVHAGRAVVFGVADDKEGTELIAVVAEVDTEDPDARQQINQRIRQTVANHTDVTVNFVTLVEAGWLIKTSSGKISRHQNRAKWLHSRS